MKVERFASHPSEYLHWHLTVDGEIATLTMDVQEEGGDGYIRKLNSYDIFVDIELNDAVTRILFEYPEVRSVIITSGKDRIFCSGANIPMLASSPHAFKVNFCKYTNETRNSLEDISSHGGPKFLAALNGVASGGGYELALACDEAVLVDDRSSAVSLPEVPLLGVLPGTGGLTRVVDKRKVRRDIADYFSTLAEGVRGKKAVKYRLVDATYKLSKFPQKIADHAQNLAIQVTPIVDSADQGITWDPVESSVDDEGNRTYAHVQLQLNTSRRGATITINAPDSIGPQTADDIFKAGVNWWPLAAFRQIEDALLHLRFNHLDIGCITFLTRGSQDILMAIDEQIADNQDNWFVSRATHYIKRVLKRIDVTSKTLVALVDKDSAYAGTLFELVALADRSFMLDDPDEVIQVKLSSLNFGMYPMGNGLTRLQTRFYGEAETLKEVESRIGENLSTEEVDELNLVTFAPDDIDWDDEIRLFYEERSGFSSDGLTGMEQNLRFAGPETMETKIFGRLSAWQNWIFIRPNAVGPQGALKSFGSPHQPVYDFNRT
jgi:benzoyl-CoA-dihydrodiol lyase